MKIDDVQLYESVDIDRELVRQGGLYEFIKIAWPQVEPAPFVDNWHIQAMAEHLEAVYRAEINRLMINVPPGSGKSLITSVFFPVWCWLQQPDRVTHAPGPATKFHYLSYDQKLSLRDAIRARDVVNSTWFQERWGGPEGVRIPFQNTRAAAYYKNLQGGLRLTVTLQGGSTGHHAHIQVVDDPIKPKDTQGNADTTRTVLQKVQDLWSGTLATRIADPSYFARVIVMQRLHDADLCGFELERGGYSHLMIPLEYEPKRAYSTGIGTFPADPRTEDQELMWKARHTPAFVEQLKKDVAPFESAQLQQDPVPSTGGIFERGWFQLFWSPPGEQYVPGTIPLPPLKEMSTCQSWDMAFKGKADSDRVAGGAFGRHRARYFLLDKSTDRRTFTQTCDAVRSFSEKWPKIRRKLVEDKANGTAVVDALQDEVPGFELVEPEGGKEARAWACSPIVKSGCFVLPHPSLPGYEWVPAYITELCRFPKAPNDDDVDMTTQALNYLSLHAPKWVQQMSAMVAAEKEPARAEVPAQADVSSQVQGLDPGKLAKLREGLAR